MLLSRALISEELYCKKPTYQEFFRRNPKVVSKVPGIGVRFGQKKKGKPEYHWSICLEGKVWKTVCRGLEERLMIMPFVSFLLFSSTFGLTAPGTGAHRLPLFFSSVHDKNAKKIK